MRNYLVYKLVRDDNKIYIGTSYIDEKNDGFKRRLCQHRNSNRFLNHSFKEEILHISTNYEYIMKMEEDEIIKYDSYNNGLNKSISGKGYGHNSLLFSTKGYKFSEESRNKMSISAKERCKKARIWNKGKCNIFSDETIKHFSDIRKGKQSFAKLTRDNVLEIRNNFLLFLKGDYIPYKKRNGKIYTHIQKFSDENCKKYNITAACIRRILKNETWKND